MATDNIPWFEISAFVGWTIAIMLILSYGVMKARRRTIELNTAAAALSAHYQALEHIVDDPALPESALSFIADFTNLIADEDACHYITDRLTSASIDGMSKVGSPEWAKDMEALAKSRPELVENFRTAVATGFIALFNRWPGTSWKWQVVQAQLASDRRKQAVFAERIVRRSRNGDHNLPGGLVPA